MAPAAAPNPVTEPFPISRIADRYFIFDVDIISHCRRAHNICGILIGTIPNLSQQNVFQGVPQELMPEEARVLVENGAAYVVDEAEAHRQGFMEMSRAERLKYLEGLDRKGEAAAREQADRAVRRQHLALKEKGLTKEMVEAQREGSVAESTATDETLQASSASTPDSNLGFIMKGSTFADSPPSTTDSPSPTPGLFSTPSPSSPPSKPTTKHTPVQKHFITPTTSYPPLSTPPRSPSTPLPSVPDSYPLFRYLHSQGYFHMPGLRFGCHYNVYPGDPLRYHSHFAATGLRWDQEFDLLDVVGGGRLGTGTKKAYMIGGEEGNGVERKGDQEGEGLFGDGKEGERGKGGVRVFSIEWAAL